MNRAGALSLPSPLPALQGVRGPFRLTPHAPQVITFDAVPWPPPQCSPARPEAAAAAVIDTVSAGLSAEERRKLLKGWCRRWHPVIRPGPRPGPGPGPGHPRRRDSHVPEHFGSMPARRPAPRRCLIRVAGRTLGPATACCRTTPTASCR